MLYFQPITLKKTHSGGSLVEEIEQVMYLTNQGYHCSRIISCETTPIPSHTPNFLYQHQYRNNQLRKLLGFYFYIHSQLSSFQMLFWHRMDKKGKPFIVQVFQLLRVFRTQFSSITGWIIDTRKNWPLSSHSQTYLLPMGSGDNMTDPFICPLPLPTTHIVSIWMPNSTTFPRLPRD